MTKKVEYIEVLGKSYPVLFSLYALQILEDDFGGIQKMAASFDEGEVSINQLIKLVHAMIVSGCEYKSLLSGQVIEPPEEKALALEISTEEDIQKIVQVITPMMQNMNDRKIMAVPKKSKKKTKPKR